MENGLLHKEMYEMWQTFSSIENGKGIFILDEQGNIAFSDRKTKEAFIKKIFHHFFNPICIAKEYLQLLLKKDLNDQDRTELEEVKTAVEGIEAVVKNMVLNGKICEWNPSVPIAEEEK